MKSLSSPELMKFVNKAYEARPSLFSDAVSAEDSRELFDDLQVVFSAWKRLRRLRESNEKISEADFVANV